MGKTIPSYRTALEMEIGRWKIYREGLKPPYQQHFDNIMLYARMHSDAGSLSARMFISESLFLSALIEQQKILEKLETDLYRIQRRMKK
uniref:DUF8156 domain-containing protein n=1 Tax=Promethearchaeum syntrophicum TaxID=2594042 RepID=A0A5B9DG37_9ARCH|nr:hypothetical protein DSAG12_03588 [Candidatus Prometheoarchaeum syntrophicum]